MSGAGLDFVCGALRHAPDYADDDFRAGGDRVRYLVELDGAARPLTVTAELWYQSIGYRWAHNLEGQRAPETDRFVAFYEASAASSAIRIASDTRSVDR